jgi:hypothetical protein
VISLLLYPKNVTYADRGRAFLTGKVFFSKDELALSQFCRAAVVSANEIEITDKFGYKTRVAANDDLTVVIPSGETAQEREDSVLTCITYQKIAKSFNLGYEIRIYKDGALTPISVQEVIERIGSNKDA